MLLQTRAARLSDVLTSQNVNEIADTQAGVIQPKVILSRDKTETDRKQDAGPASTKAPRMGTASIGRDGKVNFESADQPKASK